MGESCPDTYSQIFLQKISFTDRQTIQTFLGTAVTELAMKILSAIAFWRGGAYRAGFAFTKKRGPDRLPAILEAIERVLAPLNGPAGQVSVNGSTWVVSASDPA